MTGGMKEAMILAGRFKLKPSTKSCRADPAISGTFNGNRIRLAECTEGATCPPKKAHNHLTVSSTHQRKGNLGFLPVTSALIHDLLA